MKTPSLITSTRLAADVVVLALSFVLSFALSHFISLVFQDKSYLSPFSKDVINHTLIYLGFMVTVLFYFYGKGHYTERLPWWHQVRQIVLVSLGAMLLQGFLHYVLKFPLSRMWVGTNWLMVIPLLLLARLGVRRLFRSLGLWGIPTIIIGGRNNALETAYALHSDRFADYDLKKIMLLSDDTIEKSKLPVRYKDAEVQGGIKNIKEAIRCSGTSYVILAPDEHLIKLGDEVARQLRESRVNFGLVPPTMSLNAYNTPPRYFFGHDIVLFHPNEQRKFFEPLVKRMIDIVASSFGLLLLSPLFAVVAVLIKSQNPGSHVFFGHTRVGRGGKMFPCYKFTSMVPNAQKVLEDLLARDPEARKEWERDFKLKNDPRITRIGHVLRTTSLDELPQLMNVLFGHMSLVGPRPIVKDEMKYYGDNISGYLSVRPGITGLWQISGRNDTSYEYRVYLDTWYARNWSLWHDFVILLETVGIVLKRSGAY